MGLDNELRVSITADTEGLQGGLAEAQDQVAASSGQMAAAQATLAAANARLAETEKALIAAGANLADANSAASQSLKVLRQEAAQAAAAVAAMAPAEEAATAAAVEYTAAQNIDTKATYNRMEAMGAARVTMGAMAGSTGMMAGGLARMAAGSQVLGPLLNNMLPLVLFAAGAEMIYDLGKAIYTAFDMGGEAAEKFRDDLAQTNLGWRTTADATQAEIDKLDAANAKLEHIPNPNAQYEAIHRAAMEADKLDEKLTQLLGKEEKLTEEFATPKLAQVLTLGMGGTGVKYEDTLLKEHIRHLDEATTAQQINDEELRHAASLQTRLKELQQWQTTGGGPGIEIDYSKEIAATQHLIDIQQKEVNQLNLMNQLTAAQDKHDTLTADPKAKAAKQDPAVKDYFENEKRNLEDYTRRIQEDTRQQEQWLDNYYTGEIRQDDNANKLMEESDKNRAKAWHESHEDQIRQAEEDAKAEIQAAEWKYDQTKADIENQERLGIISHKTASQMLQDALALKSATVQGANLKVIVLFDPIMGGKEEAEYKQFQDKMKADAHKGDQEREAIVKKESQQFEKSWKVATDAFNSDFTGAMNSWMTHSETAGKAFGSMLGDMERQTIDFVAKNLLEHAEMWAMLEIMSMTGTTSLLTQQEAAAALQKMSDAKTAAANAYAWGSSWGGPVAGGIAAAIAFTAVEAFDYGGMVRGSAGSPVPIIAHAGESVLTASQTQNFRSMTSSTNQSSARASNVALHYNPVIHGNADAGMLQEHSRQMLSQVRRMVRPEALA